MAETYDSFCCICLSVLSTHACAPCGHKCLCEKCAFDIMNKPEITEKKCPICRANVSCIIRIYDNFQKVITELEQVKKALAVKGDDDKESSINNKKVEDNEVECRYIPVWEGYETPWQRINIDNCKACQRSKKGVCYTHLYVSGCPVD